MTLQKHAYSNILKISSPKNWKLSDKNSNTFHISAQNIDCGYSLEPPWRGNSNEYPQSMFLSRNKKNSVHPCKPQFYYTKVGFKGVGSKLYRRVFVMYITDWWRNKWGKYKGKSFKNRILWACLLYKSGSHPTFFVQISNRNTLSCPSSSYVSCFKLDLS